MQKSLLDTQSSSSLDTPLLCMQATYDGVEIALFNKSELIELIFLNKKNASAQLISSIDTLLKKHALTIDNLKAIGANLGPAPFTTLRTTIITINGIAFAKHVPLIGINGLDAFVTEYKNQYTQVVVLLHAFANDVYFATPHLQGCAKIKEALERLSQTYPTGTISFIGNGTLMHTSNIQSLFADRAHFPEQMPSFCSIQQIGNMVWHHYQNSQSWPNQLYPLYLKEQSLI